MRATVFCLPGYINVSRDNVADARDAVRAKATRSTPYVDHANFIRVIIGALLAVSTHLSRGLAPSELNQFLFPDGRAQGGGGGITANGRARNDGHSLKDSLASLSSRLVFKILTVAICLLSRKSRE